MAAVVKTPLNWPIPLWERLTNAQILTLRDFFCYWRVQIYQKISQIHFFGASYVTLYQIFDENLAIMSLNITFLYLCDGKNLLNL